MGSHQFILIPRWPNRADRLVLERWLSAPHVGFWIEQLNPGDDLLLSMDRLSPYWDKAWRATVTLRLRDLARVGWRKAIANTLRNQRRYLRELSNPPPQGDRLEIDMKELMKDGQAASR